MAGNEMGKGGTGDTKVTKDPNQLLADTRKAGQDAVDTVLDLIPEVEHKLPPVYPRIDVASVLNISRHHTEEALKNAHTQISDLIWTHVAGPEQAGVFFNTILLMTCSFPHQMDEMAINLLFPGSQLVPMCGVPAGKSWKDYLWWRLQVARPVGQLLWWNGLRPFRVLLVSRGQQRLQLNPVTPEQVN